MHDADDDLDTPPTLSAALETALLRELIRLHAWENQTRFGGRLTTPVFALSSATARLGQWVRATRTIELSRALVLTRPWLEVTSVLAHEMAHQYVDEVLQVRDEPPHGATFQRVCAERGIDGRAAGAPIADPGGAPEVDRVLERVRKLLALAASSNQHEAETAMRRAHELMLRHNIEAAQARAAGAYEVRHLGDPRQRTSRVEAEILGLLAEFFFVKVIRVTVYQPRVGKHGAVFEITGTRANVEMAEHVHGFLLATAERLWQENRGDARVRNGRDRISYQSGVIRGFYERLHGERTELNGTGLVWRGDADLDRYYHARHPRITRRKRTFRLDGAHLAGREAGRTIVLHRPLERGGGAGPRRLLPR